MKKPKINVSCAMILIMILNSIVQSMWILVVLYRFDDFDVIVNAFDDLAIINVFINATHSRVVTTLFVIFHIIIFFILLFNIFAFVARLT